MCLLYQFNDIKKKMKKKVGVLYIATGKKFIEEAVISAKSFKKFNKGIPVSIITNLKVDYDCFDQCILINDPSYSFRDKVFNLENSPYEVTLFLDSDTYVCADISELFELSYKFDVALAHAPKRFTENYLNQYTFTNPKKITKAFPEFNTGVILYKKSKGFFEMIDLSKKLYDSYSNQVKKNLPDQIVFREATFLSDISIATLTPEYNCRTIFPTYIEGELKIIHGRHKNYEKLANKLNKRSCQRLILPEFGVIFWNSIFMKILKKLKNN